VFDRIWSRATGADDPGLRKKGVAQPYMTEGWYCCAEPGPEQLDLV
jgi:hypothetical protein